MDRLLLATSFMSIKIGFIDNNDNELFCLCHEVSTEPLGINNPFLTTQKVQIAVVKCERSVNDRTLTSARMAILFFSFTQTSYQISISFFITPNTVNFPQSLGHISWCECYDLNVLDEMKTESVNSKHISRQVTSILTHILKDHEKYTSQYISLPISYDQ